MQRIYFIISCLVAIAPAAAQNQDCVENIAGEIVCGDAASAVRARIRAEANQAKNPDKPVSGWSKYATTGDGEAIFLRGGYIFGWHDEGLSDNIDAPMVSAGYRGSMSKLRNVAWSYETEFIYARNKETITVLTIPLEQKQFGIAGIAAMRWDFTGARVGPFVSVGVGPVYSRARIEELSTTTLLLDESDWGFGYTGRAGLHAQVSNNIALEFGYRYLGASNDYVGGLHTGELGVNWRF